MKLQGTEHSLQRSGLAGERQYGIALSSKIYSILSDKLYTDRIGSTVREVCSNAWDAQKMKSLATGEPIQPFKVTIPTDLEPHFIVEDTGPGMPDSVAQDLYSTLGLSTKEDTNDQIGAFGLGSKSPFSVTDTFTVENTHEGITHYYLCFKAENGLPSLLKTGEKAEEKPSGVKIIIPAPGYRYVEYKNSLKKQLIMMDPKPVINNIENFDFIEPKRESINEHGYILSNATDFSLMGRSIYAKMGMVLYPVDTYQVNLGYAGVHQSLPYESALILEFPIGSLEPLPSREGLTYDERTKSNIIDQYNLFEKVYRKLLREQVETKTTPLEAWEEIKRIKRTTGLDLMYDGIYVLGYSIDSDNIPNLLPKFDHTVVREMPLFDDEGKQTSVETTHNTYKTPKYVYEHYHRSDTRLNKKLDTKNLVDVSFAFLSDIKDKSNKFLLIDELESKHKIARMKSLLKTLTYGETYYFVRIDPNYPGSKTDFSDLISSLENVHPGLTEDFTYFSQVKKPVVEKIKLEQDQKPIDAVSCFRHTSRWEHSIKWPELAEYCFGKKDDAELEESEDQEDDINDETNQPEFVDNWCYITAVRNDLTDYSEGLSVIKRFIQDQGWNLLIVRKSGMANLPRIQSMGIVEFKTLINHKVKGLDINDDYRKYQSAKDIAKEGQRWFYVHPSKFMRKLMNSLGDNGQYVHKFFDIWEEVYNLIRGLNQNAVGNPIIRRLKEDNLFKYFKDEEWAKDMEIDMSNDYTILFEDFKKRYPLIEYLLVNAHDLDDVLNNQAYQYIVDYNTIHNNEEVETINLVKEE